MKLMRRRGRGGCGFELALIGVLVVVVFVKASSSTQVMRRNGNWKKEEMHIVLVRWCRRR